VFLARSFTYISTASVQTESRKSPDESFEWVNVLLRFHGVRAK
jgi:hypothetical protein